MDRRELTADDNFRVAVRSLGICLAFYIDNDCIQLLVRTPCSSITANCLHYQSQYHTFSFVLDVQLPPPNSTYQRHQCLSVLVFFHSNPLLFSSAFCAIRHRGRSPRWGAVAPSRFSARPTTRRYYQGWKRYLKQGATYIYIYIYA